VSAEETRTWDPKSKEAQLLTKLRTQFKRADQVILTFASKVQVDPDHILKTADHVFEANGLRNIAGMVIDSLTAPSSKSTFDTIQEYATERLMVMGSTIENSSGRASNIVERANLYAWAELLKMMKWI
jgi:N-acetylglucosamine kinase-like BadF-type ATPase